MNLRERLKKLQGQRGFAASPSQPTLAERLARHERRPSPLNEAEVAEKLGGEVIERGLILIERTFPLNFVHGDITLDEMLKAPLAVIGGDRVEPEALLFLDTETTGLAGGTGTLPFLLGLARIEGNTLRLCQFFLTGFTGEAAMLEAARRFGEKAAQLVSFNGKAFDVPLLATRYRLARRADPFSRLNHLDLLHPTRTAFARTWPDCRLQTAEQRLLGFYRKDDLPGALVPQVWFDFVRRGDFARVPAIVQHNRWDLMSLAALAARLAALFQHPDHAEADVLAIARAFRRRGEEDTAHAHLARRREALTVSGLMELSQLHRRRGEWEKAVAIWEKLAAGGCLPAMEALAKYHEHISRNLPEALRLARLLVSRRPEDPAFARRFTRLSRRLDR
ncbi:MAG: ribonuclease H-like domain-containing protein [Burkholderiales bacterium]|nr:ribonuclease H-like domain-containing protein [Burkholderiales bacterium]